MMNQIPNENTPSSANPRRKRRWRGRLERTRQKSVMVWVNFAERRRDSYWLPVGLFFLLMIHGFFPVIPAFLCIMAAVSINRKRWLLFGVVSAMGETANNAITYFLGRALSETFLFYFINRFHWHKLWVVADRAISSHGTSAAFFGAVLGLPNPIITALIGLADAENLRSGIPLEHSWIEIIAMVLSGYLIRNITIGGLTRFGWLHYEKKAMASKSTRSS